MKNKAIIYLCCIFYLPTIFLADNLRPLEYQGYEFNSGQSINFNQYKGKIVYLDFWASWCAPCVKSLPFMEKLHHQFSADKFKIIAINIDEDKRSANSFLNDHPISYLNLYDPKGYIGKKLKVRNMPTAFLIDQDGNILFKHSGFNEKYAKKLEQVIEQLVKN